MAKLPMKDVEKILAPTLTGMSVDQFSAEVKEWLATANHPRWDRLYTELTYQPMQEVLQYLRANGFKTYIVTGGGQDFVRVYAERVYGIPPEQVVGTMGGTKYGYEKDGKPFLTKEPKLLLNDNNAGKPEGIHLMIGRRPYAAFGNSPVIGRCWNTPRPATARGLRCWCSTMMRSASMHTVPPKVCRTPRSALSPWRCTTRRRRTVGPSSA